MGRSLSTTMQNILASSGRSIDYTLDLTFPDATSYKFATSPLSIAKGDYTNDLESISEIRQTIEAPVDRVAIGIQNKDRVLGLHVAANWRLWRKCDVTIGRYCTSGILAEWVEMFRGTVQQPNADDLQVTFDLVPDTVAPGQIVCNLNLSPNCPSLFKDAKTCAYIGGLTTCNHHLKSPGGCDGRANSHHFAGMEHRYNPDTSTPGSGGNDGSGGPRQPPCPRLDQFVLVRGVDGRPMTKMVCFFTTDDFLWHPITRKFRRTKTARVVHDQPIWELLAGNGAAGYSSFSHRVLWYLEHANGERVDRFRPHDRLLTVINEELVDSYSTLSRDTGERGDVMFIEMEPEPGEENIYCAGDSPEKLIACHNNKEPIII